MIICLTGFDKNGKTTMSTNILKEFKQFQYYRSMHQRDKITDLEQASKHDWRFLLDILQQINVDIVFDRCFIDQFAYSQVYRYENILKNFRSIEEYYSYFENYCKILSKINHLIIYFYKEFPKNVEDDFIDTSKMTEVLKYYEIFFNNFSKNLNILNCKFENGIEENFNRIKLKIKELNI